MPKGAGTAKAYRVKVGGTSTLIYEFIDLVSSDRLTKVTSAIERLKIGEHAIIRTLDRAALDRAWNEYAL